MIHTANISFFIEEVEKHKDNIHFPKFLSADKRIPGAPKWRCIRMEKLTPITSDQLWKDHLSELFSASIILAKYGVRGGLYSRGQHNKYLAKVAKMKFGISWSPYATTRDKIWQKIDKPSQDWQEAMIILAKLAKRFNLHGLDLHDTNLMLRGSTLVIIDPIF